MKLPAQLPVMPLPNAVLFPRVLLPLYIFEERYRQMLQACLAGERMFVVALLRKGWEEEGRNPTPYGVACVGAIRTSVTRPDGTSNLILEGMARVSIREYVQMQPYRVARIDELGSVAGHGSAAGSELVEMVSSLVEARARLGVQLPDGVLAGLREIEDADHLSDLVSHMMLESFHEKQLMLETLDVKARQRALVKFLQRQARQVDLWKKLQGKLPNENIGHN